MASIYTTQVANVSIVGASNNLLYTVPSQHLLIVTNVDLFVINAAAGLDSIVFIGSAALLNHISAAAEQYRDQWVGKQVLEPGQTVNFNFAGSSARIAIAGYLLIT
jgi:hypothetical protein